MLVWGLEAMAVTFVAPHSLNARPLVVPRGTDLLDGTVTLWDTGSATLRETLRGHSASAEQPEFSPDGKTLYTASHIAEIVRGGINVLAIDMLHFGARKTALLEPEPVRFVNTGFNEPPRNDRARGMDSASRSWRRGGTIWSRSASADRRAGSGCLISNGRGIR